MVDRIVSVPDSLELPAAVKVPTSRLSTATPTGKAVLDAADAAAARAAIGALDASLHLSGTGMPNGVVTAPPGTKYIDRAGTNGAWEWIKKAGNGKTGWECVSGDTGKRAVTASLINGWTATSVTLRRINGIIYLGVEALASTAATADAFILPPSGFEMLSTEGRLALHTGTTPAAMYRTYWSGGIAVAGSVAARPPALYGAVITAATSTVWPTTLPGIPA